MAAPHYSAPHSDVVLVGRVGGVHQVHHGRAQQQRGEDQADTLV
jgi:hypothetical protein